MFSPTYFAPRYFPARYFPEVSISKPHYFPHGFFPRRYFCDTYFPGDDASPLVKPPYFFHGYFPARFFADRYFPGLYSTVVIPPSPVPSSLVGAAPLIRHAPDVQAVVRLYLAGLSLYGHAVIDAGDITARAIALALNLRGAATVTPADVDVLAAGLSLPSLGLEPVTARFTRKARISSRAQDEEDLELYMAYLASLAGDS